MRKQYSTLLMLGLRHQSKMGKYDSQVGNFEEPVARERD